MPEFSVNRKESDGKIRFGLFEVDLQSAQLRKGGRKVKLQDQPFQILSMLLERPDQVVTREELRTALWPVDTFVDFDHGLNAAVKRLRDALGDSAENPRFVETLARRGYRFIAPVSIRQEILAPNSQSFPSREPRMRLLRPRERGGGASRFSRWRSWRWERARAG